MLHYMLGFGKSGHKYALDYMTDTSSTPGSTEK